MPLSLSDLGIDSALLTQALTHRSWCNEHPDEPDNERLELVGDAVLDLAAAQMLYEQFPALDEGDLTSLRAALVRSESLARYARALGLSDRVRLSRGEEKAGGRARDPILADTFEAVEGAIFLDQGWDAAKNFALGFLAPEVQSVYREQRDLDAKSVLQEFAQAEYQATPAYRKITTQGPDHAKMFVVAVMVGRQEWARGTGASWRAAEQNAARTALVQRVAIEVERE